MNGTKRYELIGTLGQGGMGTVYRALDRLTGGQVALKRVSLPHLASRIGSESAATTGPGDSATATSGASPAATVSSSAGVEIGVAGQGPITPSLVSTLLPLRLALAQEFRILASLRHPSIISVLDYGFDDEQQPYFTMELIAEARELTQAAAEKSVPEKLQLLLQVLAA